MLNKFKNQKEGAILIMSMLILSCIVIIGIAIGTIVLNQLKQAKNFDFSALAYYAADSATEEALYDMRKQHLSAAVLNSTKASATLSNSAMWKREIASTTPYSTLLEQNRPIILNLYDSKVDCGQVRCVKFSWEDLSAPANVNHPDLEVTYYAWQVAGGNINVLPDKGVQELYGSTAGFEAWERTRTLAADICYTVRVKAIDEKAKITIHTYKDAGCTNHIGIPSYLTINALGTYKGTKQRLESFVVKEAPLNNIFEYALFSQDVIIKN